MLSETAKSLLGARTKQGIGNITQRLVKSSSLDLISNYKAR
jgi:hypothetical protein